MPIESMNAEFIEQPTYTDPPHKVVSQLSCQTSTSNKLMCRQALIRLDIWLSLGKLWVSDIHYNNKVMSNDWLEIYTNYYNFLFRQRNQKI